MDKVTSLTIYPSLDREIRQRLTLHRYGNCYIKGGEKWFYGLIHINNIDQRVISQEKLTILKDKIVSSGFLSPLVITIPRENDEKFYLLDGNHRLEVLKILGFRYAPVVITTRSAEDEMVIPLKFNVCENFVPDDIVRPCRT